MKYGSLVEGNLPNGDVASLETMAEWAIKIAEKFPKLAFVKGMAYKEEYERVMARLNLPEAPGEMTDDTCVQCLPDVQSRKLINTKHDAYWAMDHHTEWTPLGNASTVFDTGVVDNNHNGFDDDDDYEAREEEA